MLAAGIPSFAAAILLLLVFSVKLKWLPASGLLSPVHYILPVTALALYPAAMIARLVGNTLDGELQKDYVLFARAKGLRTGRIILTHALKNAYLPVLNYIGPASASLLTGSFVIESIFTIPGLKCVIGGFKGRRLKDGDYIGFRIKRRYLPFFLSRSLDLDEFDYEDVTLRVVMGPQDDVFTAAGRETFLNSEYTVTSDFDRMGCRLEGPFIAYKTTADIISDGIAFGSVQVPSHGKPIVLLSDRQTTGGYAKIATVISVDIPKLAQCKTDNKVRFQAVTVEEAQQLLLDEVAEINELRRQIYQPCKEVLECRLVAKRLSRLFQ